MYPVLSSLSFFIDVPWQFYDPFRKSSLNVTSVPNWVCTDFLKHRQSDICMQHTTTHYQLCILMVLIMYIFFCPWCDSLRLLPQCRSLGSRPGGWIGFLISCSIVFLLISRGFNFAETCFQKILRGFNFAKTCFQKISRGFNFAEIHDQNFRGD